MSIPSWHGIKSHIIGEIKMPNTNKYKSVSVHIDTHNMLNKISKSLLDNTQLSISKTIELLANEKAKKLNGKLSRR